MDLGMRIRRSASGAEIGDDTRLLIEEKLPSEIHHSSHHHLSRLQKRMVGKHANYVIVFLLILLLISFWNLNSNLRQLDILNGGVYDPSPLSDPQIRVDGSRVYKIGVVTDLDHDSRDAKNNKWISWFKRGELTVSSDQYGVVVKWADARDVKLQTDIAAGGRAMELSDLVVFNRRLLTIDDRTGLVYEIVNNTVVPWIFLDDGPGNQSKPLKGEWMTVKDEELWVGGLGKEWSTSDGVYINDHPMWVKIIDKSGRVRHFNWADNYRKIRSASGINPPGYMVHESCQWSKIHKRWFFLPRRASDKQYNDEADEQRGTNMLITATENFEEVSMIRIGSAIYEGPRGFSAFQFIPDSDDTLILALKSEEIDGKPQASYVTAFDIYGKVVLSETALTGRFKFEGLSFI